MTNGDKGSLIRTTIGLKYYTRAQKGWIKPNLERISRDSLDEFIGAIKDDKDPPMTVDDAIKVFR
jgi:hypothetical protein